MATKPETTFVNSVHRHIDKRQIYAEGMANPYRGGTPDNYYDASPHYAHPSPIHPINDLWVEYKFKKTVGRLLDLGNEKTSPALSSLQYKWLQRRHANGHNAWVICGFPDGGVIMRSPEEWLQVWNKDGLLSAMMSRKEIAQCITNFVLCRAEKL